MRVGNGHRAEEKIARSFVEDDNETNGARGIVHHLRTIAARIVT